MNGTDDFIGRLEAYLDDFDGATPLPDHVRDAIHAELPGTRQVRPGAGPRRLLTMLSNSAQARWGLAAAAIVVSVVAGGIILGNNGNQQGIIAAPTPDSDRRAHRDGHAHAVCPRPPRCANDALPGPYHRDLHRARDVQAVVADPLAHHDQL